MKAKVNKSTYPSPPKSLPFSTLPGSYNNKMSNPLTQRHQWMISCLADCFDQREIIMEDWIRERGNYSLVTDFLKGTAPPKILIYYQAENGEHDDYNEHPEEPRLFITTGDTVKLKAKAAYFIRTTPEGKSVVLTTANDNEV